MHGPSIAVGFGVSLALVAGVYVIARPRIRASIATEVQRKIVSTRFRIGDFDLGHPPEALARVLATAVADGVANALP